MFIVSLDPGRTVGWARFSTEHDVKYRSGQWYHYQVWSMLDTGALQRGIDYVVCESFQYRPHVPKVDLTPVEVIGVVKEWCRQNKVPLILQTPAMGKSFWNDGRLKQFHVYRANKPHANDAMRHLFYATYFGKLKGVITIQGLSR